MKCGPLACLRTATRTIARMSLEPILEFAKTTAGPAANASRALLVMAANVLPRTSAPLRTTARPTTLTPMPPLTTASMAGVMAALMAALMGTLMAATGADMEDTEGDTLMGEATLMAAKKF